MNFAHPEASQVRTERQRVTSRGAAALVLASALLCWALFAAVIAAASKLS